MNLQTLPRPVAFGVLAGQSRARRIRCMEAARRARGTPEMKREYVRQARVYHRDVMRCFAMIRLLTP
jgi:hypothetical protein